VVEKIGNMSISKKDVHIGFPRMDGASGPVVVMGPDHGFQAVRMQRGHEVGEGEPPGIEREMEAGFFEVE
jgi:hypothetical protein